MLDWRNAEQLCRHALRDGATREEVVATLHAKGVTVVAAIKAVRAAFSLSLGEAKRLVAEHPAWRAELEANQPLHDAAQMVAVGHIEGAGGPFAGGHDDDGEGQH